MYCAVLSAGHLCSAHCHVLLLLGTSRSDLVYSRCINMAYVMLQCCSNRLLHVAAGSSESAQSNFWQFNAVGKPDHAVHVVHSRTDAPGLSSTRACTIYRFMKNSGRGVHWVQQLLQHCTGIPNSANIEVKRPQDCYVQCNKVSSMSRGQFVTCTLSSVSSIPAAP